jgi:hypothetical protein
VQRASDSEHASTVQVSESLQTTGEPPWQTPGIDVRLEQVSTPLQKNPSSQTLAVGPVHIIPGTQPDVVQTSPDVHIDES